MHDRRRGITTMAVAVVAVAALLTAGRLVSRLLPPGPAHPPASATTSPAPVTVPATTLPPGTQPNGQPRQIHLARGVTSTSYPIQALDPPTHTIQVSVLLPAQAQLRLWLAPERGTPLAPISTSDPAWCHRRGPQRRCRLEWAALPAAPGAWTVHLAKQSEAAATVTVRVTFQPVG